MAPDEDIHYLSTDDVISLHRAIEAWAFSGTSVTNRGVLEMCVEWPAQSFAGVIFHKSIWDKAASLFECIIINHPFEDGNKRTALLAAYTFLEMNDYTCYSGRCEEILVCNLTIEKKMNLEEIADWFAGRLPKS